MIVQSSERSSGPITRSLSARLVVLIVEPSKEASEAIARELERSGYSVTSEHVRTAADLAASLDKASWDIVISNDDGSPTSGVAVIQALRERELETPVVLLSDRVDDVTSLEGIAAGAEDVLKREDLYRLPYVVGRILQHAQIRQDQVAMLNTGRLVMHRKRRGMGIRGSLLATLTALLLLMASAGWWYAGERREQAHAQLAGRAEEAARALAVLVQNHADERGLRDVELRRQIEPYVLEVARLKSREIVIVDARKTILLDTFPLNVGRRFADDSGNEVGQTLRDGETRHFVERATVEPWRFDRVVAPVRSERGPVVGAVMVNYTSERVALDRSLREETRSALLVAGASLGALLVCFGVLAAVYVVLPIERLRDTAGRLSLGSLDIEVPKSPGQIGDIALGLDTLRKRLKKSVLARQSDMAQRLRAEEALRQVHVRLRTQIEATRSQARQFTLLAQMGALLQACTTREEAYRIISRFVGELFPGLPGAVYLASGAGELFEPVVQWGEAAEPVPAISAADCWALRRGQVHIALPEERELHCPHVSTSTAPGSLCVPLMAQAIAIGILHVRYGLTAGPPEDAEIPQALAEAVAEQISLSLANLMLREELRELSISDPLTGLYNRRFVHEWLTREIQRAERLQGTIGVVAIDIDYFKRVNDRFGHDGGDAVLKAVARLLQESVRGGDIACRMGGEEFAVILPGASFLVTQQRAEELRRLVAGLRAQHAHQELPPISLSCGVAAFPDHGTTVDMLLRAADQALYRAKDGGRNRVESAAA